MKLYGAKVTEQYIQLTDNKKKLKYRYPRSEEYPYEARNQEMYGYEERRSKLLYR